MAVETIDQVVGTEQIAVMKLDVEGSERRVLEGAAKALSSGRITHVVFEDHAGPDSEVVRLLLSEGYEIFSIGWTLRGPRLSRRAGECLATAYEAPSYIASLAPDDVRDRCRSAGWMTLRASFSRRRVREAVAEIGRQRCA